LFCPINPRDCRYNKLSACLQEGFRKCMCSFFALRYQSNVSVELLGPMKASRAVVLYIAYAQQQLRSRLVKREVDAYQAMSVASAPPIMLQMLHTHSVRHLDSGTVSPKRGFSLLHGNCFISGCLAGGTPSNLKPLFY
jgi:hypothetical protein